MPEYYKNIEGWFDFEDLYNRIVERSSDGAHFVEIGCWYGRSTCYMAELIMESGKKIRFDCIDVWRWHADDEAYASALQKNGGNILDVFVNNMKNAGVINQMNTIQLSTFEAVKLYEDSSLDFLFVDDNHTEAHVYKELNGWISKLKPGAILAGHDYYTGHNWNVTKAVNDFVGEKGLALEVMNNSYWIECN